ncbi:hypothetical protein FMEXI_12138 [Fusarium mexicanum]|uniref:Uncharacterized protein n=1 Tax=Fusarium mexicanum TaxID=751941 RepID=A0A8H5MKY7_9HYPO|nr:hypothetical protein FMEXI_12138 [Fusarium mexicanum]
MHTETFLVSLLATLPAARAFKFTGPDPSEPIDVNKEITITWEGEIPDNLSPKFELLWHCEPDPLHKITSDINRLVDEIDLSDREYKVRFHSSNPMLTPFADKIAANKVFSFWAIFTDEKQDDIWVQYSSQNYAMIGLDKKQEEDPEVDL